MDGDCTRCIKMRSKNKGNGEFYCDIGFKAVLRKIRSHIFREARLPLRPSELKYDIKKRCLPFFCSQVLGREIDRYDALAR